jgi:hypothetical protein
MSRDANGTQFVGGPAGCARLLLWEGFDGRRVQLR